MRSAALLLPLLTLNACFSLPGEVAGGPYSEVCKHEAAGEPILDTTGSLTITGRDDAPTELGVGAYEDGTGGLNVVACVPSPSTEILDRLVLTMTLTLFEIDDQPIDLPVSNEATELNMLFGDVNDWDEVTSWGQGDTFMQFTAGGASFTELDKQGRLVGIVNVTETDPAGDPLSIRVDLTW